MTVECFPNTSGAGFTLKCAYRLGFLESPKFPQDSLTWEVPLAPEPVAQVLSQLRQTIVPALPDFQTGCDGTVFELGLGGYMGAATFRWWCDPPPGWEAIGTILDRVLEWADVSGHLAKAKRK